MPNDLTSDHGGGFKYTISRVCKMPSIGSRWSCSTQDPVFLSCYCSTQDGVTMCVSGKIAVRVKVEAFNTELIWQQWIIHVTASCTGINNYHKNSIIEAEVVPLDHTGVGVVNVQIPLEYRNTPLWLNIALKPKHWLPRTLGWHGPELHVPVIPPPV